MDFAPVANLIKSQDWKKLSKVLEYNAHKLKGSGAGAILLANNSLHQAISSGPSKEATSYLHIVDALGEYLASKHITQIGLLGTVATTESGLYKAMLETKYNTDVLTLSSDENYWMNDIIFNELCFGKVTTQTQLRALQLVDSLISQGAQAVALACTELPMLFNNQFRNSTPLIDTSFVHCQHAVNWALN